MNDLIFNYVSRETIPLIEEYISLIKQWNRRTGLVQESTLTVIWERHVLDSLQVIPYLPEGTILDIGAGGGFPGLILAIAGCKNITLCESNTRKSIFLEEVIRKLNLSAAVINKRVEEITQNYDAVVSRACSSLENLLVFMNNVSRETQATGIFLKGKNTLQEIEDAEKKWEFNSKVIKSITSNEGKIIIVSNLKLKVL